MAQVFRLPDVGEGLTEAEIVTWFVHPGDTVKVNQPLCEIETAKALVELPSPYAGTITEIHGEPGNVLQVGTPLVTFDTGPAHVTAPRDAPEPAPPEPAAPQPAAPQPAAPAPPELEEALQQAAEPPVEPAAEPQGETPEVPAAEPRRQSVLVGYGPAGGDRPAGRRHRRPAPNPQGTEVEEAGPPGEAAKPVRHGGLEVARSAEARLAEAGPTRRAKPPVRRLAKELGVDLATVDPTGPEGVITRADVTRVAQGRAPADDTAAPVPAGGRVIPLRGVMRSMAHAMVQSAFTAPHVTVWLDADVSESLRLMRRLKERRPDVRWTPTALGLAALQHTAGRYPGINATFDDEGQAVVQHGEVRLAMAIASPRGLLVANVPGGSLADIATGATDVTARARAGSLAPEELTGSTIALTNVGVFGVDGGTPILPPGHVAILSMGRITSRPWAEGDTVVVRPVVTLALSFDHRCVDGELGSSALAEIARFLADPAVALAG